ncbi:DUF6644 family protein [Undibacterium sp. MH2W]|uniref:DUF6644 family protein n=1 Tax=Undibacterium sp. MH2W TaxID=3413044 RepID=UPI003BF3458C
MTLLEIGQWLNDTEIGVTVRESVYAFPIIEGAHLIGLALSLGLILFVDLRLTGYFLREVPVASILHALRRWLLLGFALTLSTGVVLFLAEATKLIFLPVFWLKVSLIFFAGINALWFELKWGRRVGNWHQLTVLPTGVRFAGWASLLLWFGVLSCGRLIPYLGAGL